MPHSFNKIWVHVVFSTKKRAPLIKFEIEHKVYSFLKNQLKEMNCRVSIINGMPDHIHLLFLLNAEMSIAETIKQVKGSSSRWINEENIINEKFSWQVGYAAFSVSESQMEKVYLYIKNQKSHHLKKSFQEEYNNFIQLHGLMDTSNPKPQPKPTN